MKGKVNREGKEKAKLSGAFLNQRRALSTGLLPLTGDLRQPQRNSVEQKTQVA